jgi:Domain of unknown function (DUF4287)
MDGAKTHALVRSTGRDRSEWFALLDEWGAHGREFREIADWLTGTHALSRWWAQKLIVEYQQDRGLRIPGVRSDGTFEVTASKTVAVPVDVLFDAFVDARRRRQWLLDEEMSLRTSQAGRTARFDCDDATRVSVEFTDEGPKSTVAVVHQRLTGADEAQSRKARWKERLSDLKSFLES